MSVRFLALVCWRTFATSKKSASPPSPSPMELPILYILTVVMFDWLLAFSLLHCFDYHKDCRSDTPDRQHPILLRQYWHGVAKVRSSTSLVFFHQFLDMNEVREVVYDDIEPWYSICFNLFLFLAVKLMRPRPLLSNGMWSSSSTTFVSRIRSCVSCLLFSLIRSFWRQALSWWRAIVHALIWCKWFLWCLITWCKWCNGLQSSPSGWKKCDQMLPSMMNNKQSPAPIGNAFALTSNVRSLFFFSMIETIRSLVSKDVHLFFERAENCIDSGLASFHDHKSPFAVYDSSIQRRTSGKKTKQILSASHTSIDEFYSHHW